MAKLSLSVAAPLIAALIVVVLYWVSFYTSARKRANVQCWWLPAWNCFRVVLRNMSSSDHVSDVRFRVWIRELIPKQPGSSVNSFKVRRLADDERLFVPSGQDLTIACFRLKETDDDRVVFIKTDKFGNEEQRLEIESDRATVVIEYRFSVRVWWLFRHTLTRVFYIPRQLKVEGRERDVFNEYLLPVQERGEEHKLRTTVKKYEIVTVTL